MLVQKFRKPLKKKHLLGGFSMGDEVGSDKEGDVWLVVRRRSLVDGRSRGVAIAASVDSSKF